MPECIYGERCCVVMQFGSSLHTFLHSGVLLILDCLHWMSCHVTTKEGSLYAVSILKGLLFTDTF